jgi:hypothetical protein
MNHDYEITIKTNPLTNHLEAKTFQEGNCIGAHWGFGSLDELLAAISLYIQAKDI